MSRTTTTDSIAYNLDRRRYAVTTTLIGLFAGGGIALASGGSLLRQLVVTGQIAAIVSGSTYWLLCERTRAVTGGSGYYRIAYPRHESTANAENEVGEHGTNGESTMGNVR